MDIILYSTNCPRCKVLETKLKQKGLSFTIIRDIEEMTSLGLQSAPVLQVNGTLMDFSEGIKWVNQLEA